MVARRTSPHRTELLREHARRMRFESTASESRLWQALRGRQLGVSFKRQVPLGGRCVVDFLASQGRLVVEVDGGYHVRHAALDASRDRALERLGYRVLRLDAELVMRDLPAAVGRIREAIAAGG